MPRKKRQRGRPPKVEDIKVTWETVPNPDHYALLKAVAMMLKRRIPDSLSGCPSESHAPESNENRDKMP